MAKLLAQEGLPASRNGIGKFIRKYRQTGTIHVLPGTGRCHRIYGPPGPSILGYTVWGDLLSSGQKVPSIILATALAQFRQFR